MLLLIRAHDELRAGEAQMVEFSSALPYQDSPTDHAGRSGALPGPRWNPKRTFVIFQLPTGKSTPDSIAYRVRNDRALCFSASGCLGN
jgi:hypothetical protein